MNHRRGQGRRCERLLDELERISARDGQPRTILGVCPNSEAVMKAALRSAKRCGAPLYFAVTLNQVDTDGGYTGWTQRDFCELIAGESRRLNLEVPVITAVDHGGPWLKDAHSLEGLSLDETMNRVKESFVAAIEAGYDLIHVDPTVDRELPKGEKLSLGTIVDRTVELIRFCEDYCREKGRPPVSYEVGTEEVHGGMTGVDTFADFLRLLRGRLVEEDLKDAWPCFVVGQVGTDLHTTFFEGGNAERLTEVLEEYGSHLKVHYSDNAENPGDIASAGVGGANVGPEFTEREYAALVELERLERRLSREGRTGEGSDFKRQLTNAVVESRRWEKWRQPEEEGLDFGELAEERREWLVRTGARYVWTEECVLSARELLYDNLRSNGYAPEDIVSLTIERAMDRYIYAFNLTDVGKRLDI